MSKVCYTGYEEAAAQGLVAGVNAARVAAGSNVTTFPRENSYLGTLIDDLVTKVYHLCASCQRELIASSFPADCEMLQPGSPVHLLVTCSDAGSAGAVPNADQPLGVPAAAAQRQRRHTAHAHRP
jgi:Glucose inhibited division protein A